MKYEGGFFAGFKYWVRYYDEVLGKSVISDDCPQKWDYFKPSPDGKFKSIYSNQTYEKFHGSSGDAKSFGATSAISPIDVAIRQKFRNNINLNPRIWYLDIETRVGTVMKGFPSPQKALEPVSLIQILDSKTQEVHIIGDKEFYYKDWYLKQPDHLNKTVIYHQCQNEGQMFDLFFQMLEDYCPAVVYAWNGGGFDFPYLYNRCLRIGKDQSKFCPFWRQFGEGTGESKGFVQAREETYADRYTFDLQAGGIFYIDIKRLYQKIVVDPRVSYSLNAIATEELGTRKIDHSEFRTFDDFYLGNYEMPANPTEPQKKTLCYNMTLKGLPEGEIKKAGHGQFVYYGVIDVVLLQEIDKKVGLTKLMGWVTNRMCSQYNAILGTTKPWANYIRNVLLDSLEIVTPGTIQKRGADLDKTIQGGFVRDPKVGKSKWVMSRDVNSMYPILAIAGSNISPNNFLFAWELPDDGAFGRLKKFAFEHLHVADPEKEQDEENMLRIARTPELRSELIALLKETNLTMAPNGTFYRKDQKGFLPELVKAIYKERKVVKKAMFRKEQKAIQLRDKLNHRN